MAIQAIFATVALIVCCYLFLQWYATFGDDDECWRSSFLMFKGSTSQV